MSAAMFGRFGLAVAFLVMATVALLDWESIGVNPPFTGVRGVETKDQDDGNHDLEMELLEALQRINSINRKEDGNAKLQMKGNRNAELESHLLEELMRVGNQLKNLSAPKMQIQDCSERGKRKVDSSVSEQALAIPNALENENLKPENGNLDLAYIAPKGEVAISFSTCAKCGSSSLFLALFSAIYGREWNSKTGGGVWFWAKWPKDGLPQGSKLVYAGFLEDTDIPWQHYQVVRDPVDRYISAYFSKVRCCEPEIPGERVSSVAQRETCAAHHGAAEATTKSILSNSKSMPPIGFHKGGSCLYFEEFTHLLSIAPKPMELNEHVQPQSMKTSKQNKRLTWMGTIEELQTAVEGLVHFGLSKITIEKHHSTDRQGWAPSEKAIKELCELALPEYYRLNLPLNDRCRNA